MEAPRGITNFLFPPIAVLKNTVTANLFDADRDLHFEYLNISKFARYLNSLRERSYFGLLAEFLCAVTWHPSAFLDDDTQICAHSVGVAMLKGAQ